MNIIRPIASLMERERNGERPAGYVEMCRMIGTMTPDAQSIEFTPEQWSKIRAETNRFRSKGGLGDLVHKVAGPIGQAIHWPCNERDAAGNVTAALRPGSPCAKARALLNKIKV
jgi:hypothetical protein